MVEVNLRHNRLLSDPAGLTGTSPSVTMGNVLGACLAHRDSALWTLIRPEGFPFTTYHTSEGFPRGRNGGF